MGIEGARPMFDASLRGEKDLVGVKKK